jgi:hypothetical protein
MFPAPDVCRPLSAVYGRTLAAVLEDEGTVIRRIADAIS